MGSPRNTGTLLGNAGAAINRGINDIGKGAEQIAQGNVDRGVSNWVAGSVNLMSPGFQLGERIGIKGETLKTQEAADAAAQTAQDAQEAAQADAQARKDAVRKRLDAEVALRVRTPGSASTRSLLTQGSSAQPSILPDANNTLLTTGKR